MGCGGEKNTGAVAAQDSLRGQVSSHDFSSSPVLDSNLESPGKEFILAGVGPSKQTLLTSGFSPFTYQVVH